MSDRVLVVCASRDRVYSLDRMIDSVLMTAKNADIAVYIDEDQTEDYDREWHKRVFPTFGPRLGPCRSLNHLVTLYQGEYLAYGAATDDSTFGTLGWDEWVIRTAKAFPGQIGAMSPHHDNFLPLGTRGTLMNRRRPRMDFPWVTAKWFEAVGWFCCPNCHSFYWDVVVELIGEMTQIAYAGPRDFEMMHDSAPSLNNDHILADAQHAMLCTAFERKEAVERIREAIAVDAGIGQA